MLTAGQKRRIRKGVIFDYDRVEICSCWGKISRQQEVLLTEKPNIHTCCCIAVQDPLYLSPLTTCNRNVETLVQRHSCLRSLTSWAKCLRNAPCQCTAHATTRADIRLFKSENFPRIRLFSILFKFALLSEYAVESEKNFLLRLPAESRVFLSRCISRSVPKTLCSVC